MKIPNGRMITCVAGTYMFKKCSLNLVAKCLFFYQYRYVSYHKNFKKDKLHLLVGPVEFHLSDKSSFELLMCKLVSKKFLGAFFYFLPMTF